MRTSSKLLRAACLLPCVWGHLALAVSPAELQLSLASSEQPLVLDLRPETDYQRATVPGAMHLPVQLIGKRELPRNRDIVLVADGFGLVDASAAASTLRSAGYSRVDVLQGGFSAWEASGAPDTRPPGLAREFLPTLAFKQVLQSKETFALLDLRVDAVGSRKKAAESGKADPVANFAARLKGSTIIPVDSTKVVLRAGPSGAPEVDPISLANAGVGAAKAAGKGVLLLVADDAAVAEETARRLRSTGASRFVILIGGVEAIEREGAIGLDRQGSSMNSIQPQP